MKLYLLQCRFDDPLQLEFTPNTKKVKIIWVYKTVYRKAENKTKQNKLKQNSLQKSTKQLTENPKQNKFKQNSLHKSTKHNKIFNRKGFYKKPRYNRNRL